MHCLPRGEDVELAGIEDQLAAPAQLDRLPEVEHVIPADTVHIDDIGVVLGAIADHLVVGKRRAG